MHTLKGVLGIKFVEGGGSVKSVRNFVKWGVLLYSQIIALFRSQGLRHMHKVLSGF